MAPGGASPHPAEMGAARLGRPRLVHRVRAGIAASACVAALLVPSVARADVTIPDCDPGPGAPGTMTDAAQQVHALRNEVADDCALYRTLALEAQRVAHQDAWVLFGAILGAPLVLVLVQVFTRG